MISTDLDCPTQLSTRLDRKSTVTIFFRGLTETQHVWLCIKIQECRKRGKDKNRAYSNYRWNAKVPNAI